MGLLAESKIRRKINNDPNNTKWTRDETTFGQKILRSQGWQPGQFLGLQNAPHSELHTAANSSYIRVVLKDDMKGLGFNRAKEDQVTGLDVFQDLLSRLNGKSEDAVEADQMTRLAVKTHHYVEQKWGAMRFVYGGLLIGDEMKDLTDEKETSSDSESESEEKAEPMEVDVVEKESKKEKKSKKRKAVDEDDSSEQESESKSKKRRREEKDEAKAARKKEKKEKKEKKAKKEKSKRSAEASDDESDERSKKRKSKKSKSESPEDSEKDSKKAKKEKKDKKKRRKDDAEASDSLPSLVASGTSTPTGTGTSTPQGSRNFVRSRFIAQKRQAVMDTKALAQIFMIKA